MFCILYVLLSSIHIISIVNQILSSIKGFYDKNNKIQSIYIYIYKNKKQSKSMIFYFLSKTTYLEAGLIVPAGEFKDQSLFLGGMMSHPPPFGETTATLRSKCSK